MKKWVNPYAAAFVIGAVLLTVLPLLQRRFLSAPPPVGAWGDWSLQAVDDGGTETSGQLGGKVVLMNFAPSPCDSACVDRISAMSKALGHTDDLAEKIELVTVVSAGAGESFRGRAQPRWHVLSGDAGTVDPVLERLRSAWAAFAHTDAGDSAAAFSSLPAWVVVDQNGAIRGFWQDNEVGRGNAINAARLLAKEGPNP